MSYENSSVTVSKIYCSSTRNHFCINSGLSYWRPIYYFRENFKENVKEAYMSIKYDG